jgi:methionyl-tRNA formyltransferase
MKKILLIGNDTLHRRFLINSLIDADFSILGCIFETKNVVPPFKTASFFDHQEKCFLKNEFSKHTRLDLERIDCWYFPDANCEESQMKIAELGPDLCIVSGAGLLNTKTISAFPDGLINIHLGNSLEYRGLDTNFWAIYHNDYKNVGVTIHFVDASLDTGDMIIFKNIKFKKNIKIHQLRFFEMMLAFELIQSTLNKYLTNNLSREKQEKKGRYYSFMPSELKQIVANKFNRMNYE